LWGRDRALDIAAEFRSCIGYANTPAWTFMREHVRRLLGTFRGLRTIELGSGLGKVSVLFSSLGADVTLIDYSAKQLADARSVHEYFRTSAYTIGENILALPKELHECFDVAMSFGTAEHFWGDERQAVFDSHALALRSGGLAIIWVPNKYGIMYRIGRTVRKALGRIPNTIEETPFDRNELRRRSSTAGLVDPYIRGGGTFRADFNRFIVDFGRFFRHKERWPFSGDAETNRKTVRQCAQESRARITAWGNYFSYPLVLVARRP
jgi:SAM-dependent methyltransferase